MTDASSDPSIGTSNDPTDWVRSALACIGDAVIGTDAEGRVAYMNTIAEGITGWSHDEAVGHPLAKVFRIISGHEHSLMDDRSTKSPGDNPNRVHTGLRLLIDRNGQQWSIESTETRMRDALGGDRGTVLIFRDVTERMNAHEIQARLAAIVESSDDAIVSKSLDGIIRTWNAGAERIFGYSANEAIGQTINLIIPHDRRDEERRILALVRDGIRVEPFETVRLTKSGRFVDISLTVSPIVDDRGRVTGASKIARDITEQRRARQELHQLTEESERLKRLYETIISTTPDLLYMFGLDYRIRYANKALLQMWGRTVDETIGKSLVELGYEPWHAAMHQKEIDQVRETRQPVRGEVPFTGTNGRRIYDYIFVPVFGADGEVEAVAGATRDVTERKEAEESLRDADRRKDEFLALLAHELRNPLAPLRNGLHVLKLAEADRAIVTQTRAMMERQLGHMIRLIDDLLDVSRISQNKMELRLSRVVLSEIVASAVEASRPLIDAAHHELVVSMPSEPIYLNVDFTRLSQVLSNLLTNSAKYSGRGAKIWVTVEVIEDEIVFAVKDTGIGIPREELPRIFEMFSQVDRSIERATGGLGIGLALVKGLVEMHGGTVTAESEGPGLGSLFTVRLPLTETRPMVENRPVGPVEPNRCVPRRRILVVDDNQDSAVSLSRMLTLSGNEVRTAYDGKQAIDSARNFQPDVILMDVGMPRLNGYEATRQIREEPWGRSAIIIALTGWGQFSDRVLSEEAGCDGHLVKPVDLAELEKLIQNLGARPRGERRRMTPE